MTDRPTFDDFLRLRASDVRLARLTHDVAMPRSRGLEFVNGEAPLPLPQGLDVVPVDLASRSRREAATEEAPAALRWSGRGSLSQNSPEDAAYDFAIAAHVAHRVPDLLGWFQEIFAVLRVGGVLNLALPDKRFTGDMRRSVSSLGELVESDFLAPTHPSPRQAFDHSHHSITLQPRQIWSGDTTSATNHRRGGADALSLAIAREKARRASDGANDHNCHCWVFTPFSFLDLLEGVSRLRLFPFVISQFAATEPGGATFFVCLRRDSETDPDRLERIQIDAIAYVRSIAEERHRMAKIFACE
ncbi:methyltransferase domain-containing protein [Jiella marina]|uniref:methyltransferase domain-containing protein n=1 Tax=Jiella sp. LLJ827 TaxID=2917712 RepID=UPI0021010634|nr:methyltransferase domain-containing protein [Jiella sp. LLJ827]MCQ0988614.1 class I SAM-dependent methyltransferase [Jiella sp. LLJ827]